MYFSKIVAAVVKAEICTFKKRSLLLLKSETCTPNTAILSLDKNQFYYSSIPVS